MSAQLVVSHLSFSHGPLGLLHDVNLTIDASTRAGIVGPNGAGKSTLLRLLAGELEPASGAVERVPADATVSLQRQVVSGGWELTVPAWLATTSGHRDAIAEFEAATEALAAGESGAADRYDRALQRYLEVEPATFDERMAVALDRLGLGAVGADQPVGSLSGGQRTRLQLAALELVRADVLLLDEPTNDLDSEGLAYLEELLMARDAATVVVSHDRAFLEGFVEAVFEIDAHGQSVTRYDGGYVAWQELRDAARRHQEEAYAQWTSERASLKERADRERRWAQSGLARAKRTQEPDRNIRAYKIETAQNFGAGAAKTDKALERLEQRRVEKPWEGWELRLTFASVDTAGAEVARLDAAVVDRGDFVLGPIDVTLAAGDRVLVRGPNGGGKTTMIDALFGRLELAGGGGRVGPGTVVGVMHQGRETFGDRPLLDSFQSLSGLDLAESRSQLAKLGLGAEEVERPAGDLSPGEQTRGVRGLVAALGVNTLVLDEPTNHLDLEAIEQLEIALDRFPGTVVLVTHDRRLTERFTANRRWTVTAGALFDEPV